MNYQRAKVTWEDGRRGWRGGSSEEKTEWVRRDKIYLQYTSIDTQTLYKWNVLCITS